MKLNERRIRSILNHFPEVAKIFEMYEIELTDAVLLMNIDDACEEFQIESEDLILDLEDAIQENRSTDWLAGDLEEDPQWTEGFTEETDQSFELSFDDDTVDAPTDFDSNEDADSYTDY